MEEIIDFFEIQHIQKSVVGSLPYGLRKPVELGRALALEPRLLLLDEPMTGMNQQEKEDMARFILDIHELQGCTVLLIEQDMRLALAVEHAIATLPRVAGVCVIGVPDETWGEAVKAVVEPKLGVELTRKAVIKAVTQRIARYKKPRLVEFVEALPRTPEGEIDHQAVIEAYGKAGTPA